MAPRRGCQDIEELTPMRPSTWYSVLLVPAPGQSEGGEALAEEIDASL